MKSAGILGIPNRTENWLTASTFVPLVTNKQRHKLAAEIIETAKGTPLISEVQDSRQRHGGV